jgi:hypothetical protein
MTSNAVSAGTQVSSNPLSIGTPVSSVSTQTSISPTSIGTTVSSVTQIPSNPVAIAGFQSISQASDSFKTDDSLPKPDQNQDQHQDQESEQKEEKEQVNDAPLVNNKCCSKWY